MNFLIISSSQYLSDLGLFPPGCAANVPRAFGFDFVFAPGWEPILPWESPHWENKTR